MTEIIDPELKAKTIIMKKVSEKENCKSLTVLRNGGNLGIFL